VTFEEHLDNHRDADGNYDLDAAEADRAAEIAATLAKTPAEIAKAAAKAAKQERRTWESRETQNLRKQFMQPALSPDLELDLKVPLGDSTAVEYRDMNDVRIRIRKDLRTKSHLDENRAFDAEISHWMQTEKLLNAGETVEQAQKRMWAAASP
jgi:hypothetical protein